MEMNNITPSKREILERLFNAGHITFAEAVTLAETGLQIITQPYPPYIPYIPYIPYPYTISFSNGTSSAGAVINIKQENDK